MCDARRPTNGADSEPVDARDQSCDWCGRMQAAGWVPHKVQLNGTLAWLCDPCYDRTVPESATFDEWMAWAGHARP